MFFSLFWQFLAVLEENLFQNNLEPQNSWDGQKGSLSVVLSESVDIFLKSVEKQGQREQDVRVSRLSTWMSTVGGPVMMRTAKSLFLENSHS